MAGLWDHETEVREHLKVPRWIEQDIDCNQVAAITQGGCASGAYMPAVTYYDALKTMSEHGDDVLQYLEDSLGEVPKPNDGEEESWSRMACFYMSCAVETWAHSIEEELLEKVSGDDD